MYILPVITLLSLAVTVLGALNSTQEYRLKTEVKPHQRGKRFYDNLYLYSYHTGAGLGDATFARNSSLGIKGFLNATSASNPGAPSNVQQFDLGTEFPWSMCLARSDTAYSGWQPVRVDAGEGGSSTRGDGDGFFINSTGLQWNSAPGEDAALDSFGGWIICDWWHGVPQLFFKMSYYGSPLPSSCADIYLRPEYI